MSMKTDVFSLKFFNALQALDSNISQPFMPESRIRRFELLSCKDNWNYDQMSHMIFDLLSKTLFFAKDSAGDHFGVYTFNNSEFIARFDHDDVFIILGDSISNWAREVYFNTSEYNVSAFEEDCYSLFSVRYKEPVENEFPNIYLPYFQE